MKDKYYLPETIGKCLGCGHELPDAFLDLGEMPLANSYLKPEERDKVEALYKLAVAYCPGCHLVQITHRVDPEDLFGNYLYFSSFSDLFLKHAATMAESLARQFSLDARSLVMEIGSNDGYLLQFFKKRNIPILGIEPAKNIARIANEKGISTLAIFFDSNSVSQVLHEKGAADIIIGNNVLAHIPLINGFLFAVRECLKPTGNAVFEFPYLKDLLENTEFDTIYHEHIFYYSVSAIKILAERAGLELYEVSGQDVHGGSLRVFLQREHRNEVSGNVKQVLSEEERFGTTDGGLYLKFGARVEQHKEKLVRLLREVKKGDNALAAYGAAAKGNTLLNYIGIDNNVIDFVVDRSTHKQGLLLPGTKIPILHPDELVKRMPHYTLMLAWNFAEEILAQQAEYRRRGGKFILPMPDVRVV